MENPGYATWDAHIGKDIYNAYGVLAGKLNTLIPRVESYQPPDTDPFAILDSLFDARNPYGQMWAIRSLGWMALLFQNRIPHTSPEVMTYLLYHGNQFVVSSDSPQMMFQETAGLPHEDMILLKGQYFKRGAPGRKQILLDLQNPELLNKNPEALFELVCQIESHGQADMVPSILHFYFSKELKAFNLVGTKVNFNALGNKIEDMLISMGKRDRNVKPVLQTYVASNNDTPGWYNVLKVIISSIPDKAMAHHPTTGGIDLGNVIVRSRGKGNIKTAFDDPAQLAILIRSDGLIPVIDNVKPLTQAAINQLLGPI